jgi:NAD(P)H-flavin reductase
MFKVLQSEMHVPNIHLLVVEAPEVAREMQPGQFVIVRSSEEGERIPLNVSDWDRKAGTLTIFFMNAGSSTDKLAAVAAGSEIPTVVGPLGKATEIGRFGTVLLVGGCYGIGSIYPIARALKELGNTVVTIIEARSSYLIYWDDRLAEVSDQLRVITRDGTRGLKGHISRLPEIVASLDSPVDRMIINGCTHLLKRGSDASRPLGINTIVSLNPIMIDGTGMCGVCRVTVGSETKFACVDGPDFDGHEVDWDELLQRRRTYISEETVPTRTSRCEEHAASSRGE